MLELFCSIAKFSYLCMWLIHKVYFCNLIVIIRLVAKQGEFFLHIKANLSDKYLHMSDIIATFVA